tara:strand:+ start:383 stop:799 length:417 start_codon:yes stop_codon:yes gene_type:complete
MEEIEQQARTNKDSRKSKQNTSKSKSSTHLIESLPWWVELLFVQIGLPEDWLRSYLKNKKLVKSNLKKHKKSILFYIIAAATVAYLYPFYRRAQIDNMCIQQAIEHIKDNTPELRKKKNIVAYASNLCNGGSIINTIK